MESTNNLQLLKTTAILLFSLLFFSCESSGELSINQDNLLIGNWVFSSYNQTDETTLFNRVQTLPGNSYGISFKENAVFIEHSSGWCGTPPLTFSDYAGTWQQAQDTIQIETLNYPGNYQWEITALTDTNLTVKKQ